MSVREEFVRQAFCTIFYESIAALQTDLDAWLNYYNTERLNHGYRNQGLRPIDCIEQYLQQ